MMYLATLKKMKRNKLKKIREEEGYSQEGLARELKITRQTIINLEKGRHLPSLKVALKISKVFNRKIEEIF